MNLRRIGSFDQESRKQDLYEVLASSKSIDVKIFQIIIEILKKLQISDSLNFLQQAKKNQNFWVNHLQDHNSSAQEKCEKLDQLINEIKQIAQIMKQIHDHEFNTRNYSTQDIVEKKQSLIEKIGRDENIIEFLKYLVHLTSVDNKFIQSGSNSLHLLVEMKIDLKTHSFENIKIRNTSLQGGNFAKCDLSGSEFDNVLIKGMNLNGSKLFNCKWINLRMDVIELNSRGDYVNSFCYSPNGHYFASSSNKSIILWNLRRGNIRYVIEGEREVMSLCYSPNCQILGACSGKFIYLWNLYTGKQKQKLTGHNSYVKAVSFSSDGLKLASVDVDNTLYIWDVIKGKQIIQYDDCYPVCFSPDAAMIAFAGLNYNIYLLDVETGEEKAIFKRHYTEILSICFSPDGTTLASGGGDRRTGSCSRVYLWDLKTGQLKNELCYMKCRFTSVCFSPDGTTLAASVINNIIVWNVETGEEEYFLQCYHKEINLICFSSDGRMLVSGSGQYDDFISNRDSMIRFWDFKSLKQEVNSVGHKGNVKQVCFSPDGTTLASGSRDMSIHLWDVKTGQQMFKLEGHEHCVNSVCFSPDGITLASGKSYICIWDVKTGQQMFKLEGHEKCVDSVCFSPDGTTLASGSYDNSIRLWDVKTGQQKAKLDGHSEAVISVYFSPVGTTLASGSRDMSIRLWDVKTGQQMFKLEGHEMLCQFSSISSPGWYYIRHLVGSDMSIRLWDVKTGQQMFKLEGHERYVNSVCFSPDGTTLASGSADHSIRLWDVNSGQQMFKLEGHEKCVNSVCFSSDGTTLASGSDDHSIRLWDVKTKQHITDSDKTYKKHLAKSTLPIQYTSLSLIDKYTIPITILHITRDPIFQAKRTLISKGEFTTDAGINIRILFEQN
ncbi:unnamed protein product (macronuclear) [Paramecium tetraurelia]|uniref:Uncharacterized protein n=1 Tax=Paramecium tetraurelia TaxID=5888 RepID=A0EG03_PARTE|nr:uncharacterized protein GSPATT00026567001 [Paramecium tetraurelia]CAK94244.1 unnamed protein product [Paramecium tetraurelia]|eukprot:XP_001461617.1 hypothetical protein (macronuclear) [Paramecium tetraurelia strain d4-2]